MSPFVFTTDDYEQVVTSGTYRYTLPDYVYKVRSVKGRDTSSTGDWTDLSYWEQVRGVTNNYFYIRRSYGDWTLILKYDRNMPEVIGNLILGGDMTNSAAEMTLAAASDSTAVRLESFGYLKVGNEIVSHTGVYDTSTHKLTVLTRGQRGTTAVVHTSGDEVSPMIEVPSSRIYPWLIDYSMGKLHRMRLTGVASADLAGDVTAMREYDAAAERNLRRIIPPKSSRIIFERPRRYWKKST
jgi:hypothetical protein